MLVLVQGQKQTDVLVYTIMQAKKIQPLSGFMVYPGPHWVG